MIKNTMLFKNLIMMKLPKEEKMIPNVRIGIYFNELSDENCNRLDKLKILWNKTINPIPKNWVSGF